MIRPISRAQFQASRIDEYLDFAQEHPGLPMGRDLRRRLMLQLCSAKGALIDLGIEGQRILLACVVDKVESNGCTTDLCLLGLRKCDEWELAIGMALDLAAAWIKDSTRPQLSLTLPESLVGIQGTLGPRGLMLAFVTYEMRRDELDVPPGALPVGALWRDVDKTQIEAYYRLVRDSFANIPGVGFSPLDEFTAVALSMPIRPRLLWQDGRAIGFCRVQVDERTQAGEIQMIGRDLDFKGKGLGQELLSEAMRLLAGKGVEHFELSVLARNQQALGLYLRNGFQLTEQAKTFTQRPSGGS